MKLATILLSICAAQATLASHVHVKMSNHKSAPGPWQPCTEEIGCTNSECVRQSPEYAQCMPPLKEGELCGRYVDDRPEEESQNWEASCVDGYVCVLADGKDMRCVAEEDVELTDVDDEDDDGTPAPTTAAPTTQTPAQTSAKPAHKRKQLKKKTSPIKPAANETTPAPTTNGGDDDDDDDDDDDTTAEEDEDEGSCSDDGSDEAEYAEEGEQCAGEDWAIDCSDDFTCVMQGDSYGACMPEELGEGELCGQNGDQVWEHVCEEGLECVQKNGKDMRCEKSTTTTKKAHKKHHSKQKTTTAQLWQQCGGQGWTATCVNSVCVKESEWYSQCMPAELDDGMLCGQNGDQKWQHKCKAGLQCVQKDGKDMRCVKKPKHKKAHKKHHL